MSSTSVTGAPEWEPLPQRRPREGRRKRTVAQQGGEDATSDEKDAKGNAPRTMEWNVEVRRTAKRAMNTLESTDGCDGEKYEYLDHTADVQCHTWGKDLTEAFNIMIPCMFNYMTDITTIDIDPKATIEFEVEAHDMQSLLFRYMDEFLFRFCTDGFACKTATILSFDRESFKIKVRGEGEKWDPSKHPQGTEIKAITYSAMQIIEEEKKSELFVIVDI
jgi:SHS2 domain-containing protein